MWDGILRNGKSYKKKVGRKMYQSDESCSSNRKLYQNDTITPNDQKLYQSDESCSGNRKSYKNDTMSPNDRKLYQGDASYPRNRKYSMSKHSMENIYNKQRQMIMMLWFLNILVTIDIFGPETCIDVSTKVFNTCYETIITQKDYYLEMYANGSSFQ